jgi:arginine decarboxylase
MSIFVMRPEESRGREREAPGVRTVGRRGPASAAGHSTGVLEDPILLHRGLPVRGWHPSMQRNLQIRVRTGTGRGPTPLAAFDAALRCAGVANFNLIRLSSVIPQGAVVDDGISGDRDDRDAGDSGGGPEGNFGDRLYVVMAERRATRPGEEAWAGLGWVQEPESGRGMFVEHDGARPDPLVDDVRRSLGAVAGSRSGSFGPVGMRVAGIRCQGEPACAVVVAAYRVAPWAKGT